MNFNYSYEREGDEDNKTKSDILEDDQYNYKCKIWKPVLKDALFSADLWIAGNDRSPVILSKVMS